MLFLEMDLQFFVVLDVLVFSKFDFYKYLAVQRTVFFCFEFLF